MGGWWIADLYQNGQIVLLVSWIFWVIASITLHELAHGWTAVWQGDNTPRATGHLTLNPYVHMGGWSIIVFLVVGIAWGLMPVNPSRFRSRRWGRVLVAAAGPAMNIALLFGALMAAALIVRFGDQGSNFILNAQQFFIVGAWLNILLALLNLLPIPPLDGSTILSGFSRRIYFWYQHPNAQIAGLALVMILMFTGVFGYVFGFSLGFVVWLVGVMSGTTPELVL